MPLATLVSLQVVWLTGEEGEPQVPPATVGVPPFQRLTKYPVGNSPFDGVDAVQETDALELPPVEEALTSVGALSVPTLALALPLPWLVQ